MRTMHLGPEEVLLGMKVIVDDSMATRDATQFIDMIEARLRAELLILKRIYIELGSDEDPKARMTGATSAQPMPGGSDTDTL